jgi:predicted RNA-binding protein with TRAM domain
MTDDVYIYGAITVDPPITERELAPKIAAGEYRAVTWEDDGRMGDGYFVTTAPHLGDGLIGIGFTEVPDGNGAPVHVGRYLGVDPTRADHHRDVEDAITTIVTDFATAPDGQPRTFSGALCIETGDQDQHVAIIPGSTVHVTITRHGGSKPGKTQVNQGSEHP